MSEEKYRVVNAHGQKVVIDNGGRCLGSLDEIVDRGIESNSAEWVAVSERLPEDDKPVEVKVVARYMHYKPKSQQFKQGIKGRWQLHNSYAWNNTNIEITTYLPTPPAEESSR